MDTYCPPPPGKIGKDLIPTTLESFVELAIDDFINAWRLRPGHPMTMAASAKVIKLRQLLNEKFPEAHAGVTEHRPRFPTGVTSLDQVGIPKGALTEIVSQPNSQGSSLLINGLLNAAQQNGYHLALIDGQDSFDPQSAGHDACQRMLWIRCRDADEALKAADLIFRDGNLPLSILDLRLNTDHELRRISKQVWYRLQTLVQRTQGVGMILTPRPMISSASVRFDLGNTFHLDDLERSQHELIKHLVLPVTRRRSNLFPHSQPRASDTGLREAAS